MSTIKSSAENLTLNADGANNDIIFQSNGSNVATLDQAGLLTATTFAGSGSSLTALPAAQLTGTLPAIDGSNLTSLPIQNRPNGNPIVINGDMAIAQRSTSVTGIGNGDSGYHTVDRWNWNEPTAGHITSGAEWTQTQETLTSGAAWEDGFTKALKMDCTTAEASPAASDGNFIQYMIEGADVKAFKKGTPNAQTYTVSFWVKATKTGTNCINLGDRTNDRYIAATYTINTTNTWEKKVINLAADTTGSIGAGSYYQGENGQGMRLIFGLYGGSEYSSGGSLQTSWASWTTNKRLFGQVNNADSTSNNWHITGVQLEVGTYTAATLPPFQHESFGDSLARCKRYYWRTATGEPYSALSSGVVYSSTEVITSFRYPVLMRGVPTMAASGSFSVLQGSSITGTVVFTRINLDCVRLNLSISGGTTGRGGVIRNQNDSAAYISGDAEL